MAKFKQRRTPSEPVVVLVTMTQSPHAKAVAFSLCFVALIWLWREENQMTRHPAYSSSEEQDDFFHTISNLLLGTDPNNRCLDQDDPPEWSTLEIKRNCQCPDPLSPKRRPGGAGDSSVRWEAHHQRLVGAAQRAASHELEHGHELDVVLLGDSIVERWSGTRGMGQETVPENRAVFDKWFGKNHVEVDVDTSTTTGAPLNGLALGTAGDTTVELLWHLQNGLLLSSLQPKVFVLIIGTNDLGSGCSKRVALAGLLNAAHYLHTQRPDTPILLHGLLPRTDTYADGNYTLNRYFWDILWINRKLKRVCWGERSSWCHHSDTIELNKLLSRRLGDGDRDTGSCVLFRDSTILEDRLGPGSDCLGQCREEGC